MKHEFYRYNNGGPAILERTIDVPDNPREVHQATIRRLAPKAKSRNLSIPEMQELFEALVARYLPVEE